MVNIIIRGIAIGHFRFRQYISMSGRNIAEDDFSFLIRYRCKILNRNGLFPVTSALAAMIRVVSQHKFRSGQDRSSGIHFGKRKFRKIAMNRRNGKLYVFRIGDGNISIIVYNLSVLKCCGIIGWINRTFPERFFFVFISQPYTICQFKRIDGGIAILGLGITGMFQIPINLMISCIIGCRIFSIRSICTF